MTSQYDMDDDDLVTRAMERYKEARRFSAGWRKDAKMLYEFRAGHQWTDDELSYLEEQQRPPVTFNRAGTIIDAVVGNEISNRQDIRYFPRTWDDSALSEVATQSGKWVRDQCNAEDEESDCFEDVLICGMGWTETRIDYDFDVDGKIIQERVDPIEMSWDPSARKHNLEDAGYLFREKWIDKDEVKALWPDAGEIVGATDAAPELDMSDRNADPPFYEREATGVDKKKGEVRVLEYHWCERKLFYRVENPTNGKVESITDEQFKKLQKRIPNIRHVKQKKKCWYRAFIAGNTLLEKGECPIKEETNFKCITGKRDRKDNCWYGLMRGMKDPQEWANKFFSQILHIINSNSKGGVYYESGAFKDPNVAKEQQAKPEGMIELNPGGLNKIKERAMFQFPASIDRMLEFAISSIRDVPGVNLELMGAANRDQAGVLEQQRQRQALAVLAPMFSNLRRFRKNQGRLLIKFIREYIADGRLMRVVGEDGAKMIPLLKDPLSFEFDIVVDQSPSSPNMKTEAWVALTNVLPVLQNSGFPVPKEIVDILPLPESIIGKWKEAIKSGNQLPPEVQQKMQEMQQEMQKLQQENNDLKQKHDLKAAEMQADHAISTQGLQLEQARMQQEGQLKSAQTQQDIALKQAEVEAELELKRRQFEQEMELERQKFHAEMALETAKFEAEIRLKEKTERMKLDSTVTDDQIKDAADHRSEIKDIIKQLGAHSGNIETLLKGSGKKKRYVVKRGKNQLLQSIEEA